MQEEVEIYAWIGEDIIKNETGIICILTPENHPMPLVAKELRVAKLFTPFVMQSFGHKNMRLLKFKSSEVITKV